MWIGYSNRAVSNEDLNDMKIVKSLEGPGLLIKVASETVKSELKEQKSEFLVMLLGTLGASLLGNMLPGEGAIRAGEGKIKVSQDFLYRLIL